MVPGEVRQRNAIADAVSCQRRSAHEPRYSTERYYCGVPSLTMASCSCGGCASCSHTSGCMDGIANGFICRVSSLTPCTTRGWHCTRSVFFCSTWSPLLPCTLSDERTPTNPIILEAEQPMLQGLYALTVA